MNKIYKAKTEADKNCLKTVRHCLETYRHCSIAKLLFSTQRAKLSGVVYCNRSCLWVCLCVYGTVTTITRNCAHRSSPNWVCRWR